MYKKINAIAYDILVKYHMQLLFNVTKKYRS